MKINLAVLSNTPTAFSDQIDLSKVNTKEITSLVRVGRVDVEAWASKDGDFIDIDIVVDAEVILECAYSLEHFGDAYHLEERLTFTDKVDLVDDNIFLHTEGILDLTPYVYGLILTEVPIKAIKPGAELPKNGDGYRVLSEDEYFDEASQKTNSAFDILDELEFDDEE